MLWKIRCKCRSRLPAHPHLCCSFYRSAYCAASVASLTNILTPKLFEDTTNWILRYNPPPPPPPQRLLLNHQRLFVPPFLFKPESVLMCFSSVSSCQNWEGGLSGVPGLEAHGGYTFCGTAALVILGKEHMLDLKALLVRVT